MASLKQQQYRRLMKEQKSSKSAQKVDHPLAKYNSLNQLSCIVCGVQIKSELLWTSHLHSRKHKEAVVQLKNEKSSLTLQPAKQEDEMFVKPSAPPPAKRKSEVVEVEKVFTKKPRQEQPSNTPPTLTATKTTDSADSSYISTTKSKHKRSKRKSGQVHSKTTSATLSGIPSNFFDSGVSKTFRGHGEEVYYESSSDSEDERSEEAGGKRQQPAPPPPGVPSDFFDRSSSSKSFSKSKGDVNDSRGKGAIPEGFFDDPKLDAKVRKVEYKDPMKEEWEKFQKTIQKEDDVSEALQFEEDEEVNEERERTEVNEQVSWFTKAEQLRIKQEVLIANRAKMREANQNKPPCEQQATSTDSDDEELDIDALSNWRAKIS